jgi:O-antigen/teichoic acid export membrane protein
MVKSRTLNEVMPKSVGMFWRNSLYRNASYLVAGNVASALLGFAFWTVAARYYSAANVGIASSVVAAMPLVSLVGTLGLQIGIVRFLPGSKERGPGIINASLLATLVLSTLVTIAFVLRIDIWSADLVFLRNDPLYFLLFVLFTTATAISMAVDSVFVAVRRSVFAMARNVIFGLLKLVLIAILAFYSVGYYGILNAWGISLLVSVVIGVFFMLRVYDNYPSHLVFDWNGLSPLVKYGLSNSIGLFAGAAAVRILPILILNVLGAEQSAYFFIAWTIANTISLIPSSISASLLAEGSHDERSLKRHTIRGLVLTALILIPILIVVFSFADRLLGLFGEQYARNSGPLLRVFAVSLLPGSIYQVYVSTLRVRNDLTTLAALGVLSAAITIVLSYWLLTVMGILGAGVGYLASQTSVGTWIVMRERRAISWHKRPT